MKKQKVSKRIGFVTALAIAVGVFSAQVHAEELKLSQMNLESTKCPFSSADDKLAINQEPQPSAPHPASSGTSIAAE